MRCLAGRRLRHCWVRRQAAVAARLLCIIPPYRACRFVAAGGGDADRRDREAESESDDDRERIARLEAIEHGEVDWDDDDVYSLGWGQSWSSVDHLA